jgi:hypothetical protein
MRFVSVASLLALVLATTALAVPSATKDPSQLILARTDFPAGAKYTWGQMPKNYIQALAQAKITAKAAYFHTQIGSGSKAQTVDGLVTTTASTSQAKMLYRLSKEEFGTGRATPTRLPSYGDEQTALITTKTVSKIEVMVRTNRVVWQVETALAVPKATLIAQIKKYASKQQRRIGAG